MTKADPQTSYSFMQQVFVSKSHQACHIACRMQLCSVLGFLRHRQCFWKQSFMPVSFIWPAVVSWISCHGWVLWNCSCCAYFKKKKKWNTIQRQKRLYFEKCLDWRHHFSVWLPARLHLLLEAWCDSVFSTEWKGAWLLGRLWNAARGIWRSQSQASSSNSCDRVAAGTRTRGIWM